MRNSSRLLHVILFSCFLVKLFYFSVLLLLFFLATVMLNKDEYKTHLFRNHTLGQHRSTQKHWTVQP